MRKLGPGEITARSWIRPMEKRVNRLDATGCMRNSSLLLAVWTDIRRDQSAILALRHCTHSRFLTGTETVCLDPARNPLCGCIAGFAKRRPPLAQMDPRGRDRHGAADLCTRSGAKWFAKRLVKRI